MIFFCHVQRTAGTTIHRHFSKVFGGPERVTSGGFISGSRWLVLSGTAEVPGAAKVVHGLPDRQFYLGGHVGLHDLAAAGIDASASDIVLSTVRDPVERALSLFYLSRRSPDWFPDQRDHIEGRGFDYFYKFCRDSGAYFNNDHCRLIAATEDFEQTRSFIETRFSLVGSMAYMGAFERAIERMCAPVVPGFRIEAARENAALHEQTADGSWLAKATVAGVGGQRLVETIQADNEADVRLVDYVERCCGGLFCRDREHSTGSGAARGGVLVPLY
jgi:hypothetical protein